MDLQEVGWVGMYWIDLVLLDIGRWRAITNAVMSSRVPYNEGKC